MLKFYIKVFKDLIISTKKNKKKKNNKKKQKKKKKKKKQWHPHPLFDLKVKVMDLEFSS